MLFRRKRKFQHSHRNYIIKCPKCGSTDLYYESGMIAGHVYHCKNCGYIGSFVVEEYTEENKMGYSPKDKDDEKQKDLDEEK